MKIINCDTSYSGQILDIFNDAILHTTALYDYKPRTIESMKAWFDAKAKNNFPVIGITDADGSLLGFGSYGSFRAWPAYKYTVELSLYIHQNHRGKGLGKIILQEIIHSATKQDYHCIIAGIDADNAASIALHKSFGFAFCGKFRQVGYKFGRWLDLAFYQLILQTPEQPDEE
jgi:L-amino acid N-acyltransferase